VRLVPARFGEDMTPEELQDLEEAAEVAYLLGGVEALTALVVARMGPLEYQSTYRGLYIVTAVRRRVDRERFAQHMLTWSRLP